jgi:ParB-like chromosome segregation protein Spo0J
MSAVPAGPAPKGAPASVAAILASCQRIEVDPNLIHPLPGNPEPPLSEVEQSGLLASLDKEDQLSDVIFCPWPPLPGHYGVPDGMHRVVGLRHLGKKVRGLLLTEVSTDDQMDTLHVALAATNKKVDKGMIGLRMFTWLKRVEGRTERDVSENFGKHPSYVNKLLAPFKNGVGELVEALLAHKIAPTAAPFVASLPPEQQRQILPQVIGRKRSAVESICKPLQPGRAKGAGKPFKATVCGFTLATREAAPEKMADKLRSLRDRIGEVLKQVEREPRLAPAIVQLLAG